MQFSRLIVGAGATVQNTTNSYWLLVMWGNSFSIQDPDGNTASGTIAAYVATNSIVLVPPNWKVVSAGSQVIGQILALSYAELVEAVTSQVPQ